MAFELPKLPYDYKALEPHIDAKTMEIHHTKHHNAYVTNLNAALEKVPEWQKKTIEQILSNLSSVPEEVRTQVRNNGGGHANHSLFWQVMNPKSGGEPTGVVADAIKGTFGNFGNFKDQFSKAAATRFGSGWAWLSVDKSGKVVVESSANQDSPIMEGRKPVLGLDVWEHAYYLNYQNRRPDYVAAWWNVVNWAKVNELFVTATS